MSVHIKTTTLASGAKRHIVRYRRGGRQYPLKHAGSFPLLKDAKTRRDLIRGELAAGRDPQQALQPKLERRLRTGFEVAEAYKATRIDLVRFPEAHLHRFKAFFGERLLEEQTHIDVQEFVNANVDLKPTTLKKYLQTAGLIFDFAGVEPNPLRDRRVRTPRIVHETIMPPTGKYVLALLEQLRPAERLPLVTMEQTAITIGELCSLAWGDVDLAESRFRLQRANVKGQIAARARWVQVPTWLMALIAETCPFEERERERRVFDDLDESRARKLMRRACQLAGIPLFSPHDLRHRRISLWHQQGIPVKNLAERAGHARATLTLDLYSHVMPDDEIPASSLQAILEL